MYAVMRLGSAKKNDFYARIVSDYPKAVRSLRVHPLPHVKASIAEMTRRLERTRHG